MNKKLTNVIYDMLQWEHTDQSFDGLVGWKGFYSDNLIKVGTCTFLAEVKKVSKGSEYGYSQSRLAWLLRLSFRCTFQPVIINSDDCSILSISRY